MRSDFSLNNDINRHEGTLSKIKTKDTMSLDTAPFFPIVSGIDRMGVSTNILQIDKAGDKVLLSGVLSGRQGATYD